MVKMVLGLIVVLGILGVLAWMLKRMAPGIGKLQSAVRIVGGVSVGTRERVVVVEIADRWLVVGVAPGQVSALANLEVDESYKLAQREQETASGVSPLSLASAFSTALKHSKSKFGVNEHAK
ncbi:MAG: flagellar biosynthetic protein FliO [Betaproteobacteria bacterium HGW-Betaproteobacteria-22]|nr:MAG: flagellar biosynthetic protein FliO [Betaproteobacteria bacterium HGW-Betaproteobacteria-22]